MIQAPFQSVSLLSENTTGGYLSFKANIKHKNLDRSNLLFPVYRGGCAALEAQLRKKQI